FLDDDLTFAHGALAQHAGERSTVGVGKRLEEPDVPQKIRDVAGHEMPLAAGGHVDTRFRSTVRSACARRLGGVSPIRSSAWRTAVRSSSVRSYCARTRSGVLRTSATKSGSIMRRPTSSGRRGGIVPGS